MAYKESNPTTIHLVQFTIVLTMLLIIHLLFFLMALNILIATETESADALIPIMASIYGISCFFPYGLIYIIIAFSVSLIRRGVYGAKHAAATLASFFFGVLGIIVPPFFVLLVFMLIVYVEKTYAVIPLFIHLMPAMVVVGLYLFIKDIGGRKFGNAGMVTYMVSTALLILTEASALFWVEDLSLNTVKILSALGSIFAAGCVAGLIILLIGFVHAFKWVKENKPLLDEQQKQQLQMQQHQILMQQRQLEMQHQQLEMQKRTIHMLGEVHHELIADRGETKMLPHNSNGEGSKPPPRTAGTAPNQERPPAERDQEPGQYDRWG
ncbi:MAG: hypothetical protein ACMUIG_08765 [Thermoplasmatota archaeon]